MDFFDAVTGPLREALARVEDLDLWPPWEAAQDVVDAVSHAISVASEPPGPDPADVDDAADEWRLLSRDVGRAGTDLSGLRGAVSVGVWRGGAGDAFRRSVGVLERRVGSVPDVAEDVRSSLVTLSSRMTDARTRHQEAWDGLHEHLHLSWGDMDPFAMKSWLAGIVGEVVGAITDLIGAYDDASDALTSAQRTLRTATGEMELPTHLPDVGLGSIDLVNHWDDDVGPLRGTVLARGEDAYEGLSPADRRAVDQAMAGADPDEAPWILAGLAGGLTGAALTRYLQRLAAMTPQQREALDPTTHGLQQAAGGTTCGPSSLLMAKMLNDPAYAMRVLDGYDPRTGETLDGSPQDRFLDEGEALHEEMDDALDSDGGPQLPWPQAVGTQPWALANEMSASGGTGVPGTEYEVDTVAPSDPGRSWDRMVGAVEEGHSVPLYVGNGGAPTHVVMVTGADSDGVTVYNPASGENVTVTREEFEQGDMSQFGNPAAPMDHLGPQDSPWFTVVPT